MIIAQKITLSQVTVFWSMTFFFPLLKRLVQMLENLLSISRKIKISFKANVKKK